jgi:hypothetical protein
MSHVGTFETCRPALKVSAFGGRPEVIGAWEDPAPRNDGEPFGPVQPVAGEDLLLSLVQVNGASWGLMKPGIFAGVAPSIAWVTVRLTITPLKILDLPSWSILPL